MFTDPDRRSGPGPDALATGNVLKAKDPIPLSRVFLILSLFKILYFLTITVVLQIWPVSPSTEMGTANRQEIAADGSVSFPSHFRTWDAEHYLYLSKNGYSSGLPQNAFYPLWPLAIRGFSVLTGSHSVAGLILANTFSLAAFTLFFGLVRDRFGSSVATRSLVLLILFPGAIFYQFMYSESLFLLLLVLLWLGLEKGRYGLAMTSAILLPMTRAIGLFVVVPIAWFLFVECYIYLREKYPYGAGGFRWIRLSFIWECRRIWAGPKGFLLLAPILGWGGYLTFMMVMTGNPFEGFEAQKRWGIHSIGNLYDLPKFLAGFLGPAEDSRFWVFVMDRAAFYLFVLSLLILWRRDKNLLFWALAMGIVPALTGTFWAYTRFAAVVFPMFVALALWMNDSKTRPLFPMVSLGFMGVNLMFLWRFLNYRWAG